MASTSPRRATIIRSGYGMQSTSKAQPKSRVLSPIATTQEASGQWPGRPTGSVSPRQARIVLYACGKQYESIVLEVTLTHCHFLSALKCGMLKYLYCLFC